MTGAEQLFDRWPDPYEAWFQTPIGALVLREETAIIRTMATPLAGEKVLDAGCGTGLFTRLFTEAGARITGLDISIPMLVRARRRFASADVSPVAGSLTALPFENAAFDKTISITAIEFVPDGMGAVSELFRVTRPGGTVVVATLNRLSPWADRRIQATSSDPESIFHHTVFRSPAELAALSPVPGEMVTAIHFNKDDPMDQAVAMEADGRRIGSMNGAFVVAVWRRPDMRSE